MFKKVKENINRANNTMIQYYNSVKLHDEIKIELGRAIEKVVEADKFVLGENVFSFEKEFSVFCESEYCVSCGSGLDAIRIILQSLNIGIGDEVIIPANTFIATAFAVTQVGAKPVLAEPDLETYNINPCKIEKLVTSRTKAIIAVHLYGRPSNMKAIKGIADKYGLYVIEDAAQAHGARVDDFPLGYYSDAVAYSFFPTKNMGAFGDAGAIVTNNKIIADNARMIGRYGSPERYKHLVIGLNSRMDEIQAAVLRVKLKKLNKWIQSRRDIAEYYLENIKNKKITLPCKDESGMKQVWFAFVVGTEQRDELRTYLYEAGIETLVHYPVPLFMQPCYKDSYDIKNHKTTTSLSKRILSLPLWTYMDLEKVKEIVNTINKW